MDRSGTGMSHEPLPSSSMVNWSLKSLTLRSAESIPADGTRPPSSSNDPLVEMLPEMAFDRLADQPAWHI